MGRDSSRWDSDGIVCLLSGAGQQQQAGHPGPALRPPRFHDEIPAEAFGGGPHVGESVAPFVVVAGETGAVVGHRQPESILPEVQLHQYPSRLRVTKGVGQDVVSYGEQRAPASTGRDGFTPFWIRSAGTEVTCVNVATCDPRVRPSSWPSNMPPMSMGWRSCQMAVFDSREVASSLAASSRLESPASCLAALLFCCSPCLTA